LYTEKRNAYRLLVGRPERKRPLGRPKHMRVHNIKMNFREIGWDGVDWINMAVEQPGFPSTLSVRGQIYHKAGSLLPLSDQPPKFIQLYFIGNEQEVRLNPRNKTSDCVKLTEDVKLLLHESLLHLRQSSRYREAGGIMFLRRL
jgi:hypothetical protein